MKVTFWGTRGSISVAGHQYARYGGNTTCLHVESPCLPNGHWLVIDGGTGIIPLGARMMQEGVQAATILSTHWHHDHTGGFFMWAPLLTEKNPPNLHFYGPVWNGLGPRDMFERLMVEPYFPVNFERVKHHVSCKGLKMVDTQIFVIHPVGGIRLLGVAELNGLNESSAGQLKIGQGRYAIDECLVIRMFQTNHPEYTVSYRFEERPTGKVFVFTTDHEDQVELPQKLRQHLSKADLLVMDAQFTYQEYRAFAAGFGHGTPEYCVRIAHEVGARSLGLTHHAPSSTDEKVDTICSMAKQAAAQLGYAGHIFACADYMTVDVGATT